ncbi:AsmA family protein [Stappia sp. ICDLI1TA098]
MTLIAVLLAALVGPFLVDWTAYRTTFERYGEQMLGHRVAVMGEAEMRLLPTPTLTFTDVRVGEPEDPLLAVSRFTMRVELPPLLKGEIRVIDMTMDAPSLRLSIDEQGRLDWFTARDRAGLIRDLDPDLVMLEQATIRDGRLSIIDARSGRTHRIEDVDLTVAARSLLGPFKIDGMASLGGERATVMLTTGRRDAEGGLRLRASVIPVSTPVDLVMDGRLAIDDGRPAYEGGYTLASVTVDEDKTKAWRSEGAFALDMTTLNLKEARFSFGPEERPVSLEGTLAVSLAEPYRFDLEARAKQLDLDRISGRGPQEPLSAREAGGIVLDALQALPHPAIAGTVKLAVPGVISGGGLIQDVRLEADRLASGWRVRTLEGQLPGRTEFLARGDIELTPKAAFRGSFAASVVQPNLFADWWRKGGVAGAVVEPFAVDARVAAASDGVSLTDMSFEIAGQSGRGAISYRLPAGGPPRLEADLDAELLDADQARLLVGLFLGGKDKGLDIAGEISARIFAQKVKAGAFSASGATLKALYANDTLSIDTLSIDDLAGARIAAEGKISSLSSTPSGKMTVSVDADRLDGVAGLLSALVPEAGAARFLARRAEALSPARLELVFTGEASGAGAGATTLAGVTARGTAGGTAVDISAGLDGRLDAWRAARLDLSAGLSAADGAGFLAQAGLPVLPVAAVGDARLELSLSGRAQNALEGSARFYLGKEASLAAVGEIILPKDGEAVYSADVTAKARDLMSLAILSGRLPSLTTGSGAVDLVAGLEGKGDTFTLKDIAGRFAEAEVDGALDVNLRRKTTGMAPRVRGRLVLSTLDLAAATDLVLGPDEMTSAETGVWSTTAFGQPLLPDLDIGVDLSVGALAMAGLPEIVDLEGRLTLTPEALALDISGGKFADGAISGAYAVKRSGGQASLTGSVKLEGADLAELVWRRGGRAVATGRLDLTVDAEGTGRSLAGIVSGLAGGMTLGVSDGEIRRINPNAFALVIRAVDAGMKLEDDTIRQAFASHLDAGVLPFEALEASGSIAGGVLRVNTLRLDTKSASVFGGAQVDLKEKTLQSEIALKVEPGENAVTGAEPQVGLVFSGALAAPERGIDIAPFTAFLTLRAFEQEVRRVEDLQAEIGERDRLMRELRRQREIERRKERETQERELKRQEDARRAVEEEAAARAAAERAAAQKAEQDRAAKEKAAREAAEKEAQRKQRAAPQRQGATSPAAGFGDRIRRALEDIDRANPPETTGSAAKRGAGEGAPMQLLPPLDPPVYVGATPDR